MEIDFPRKSDLSRRFSRRGFHHPRAVESRFADSTADSKGENLLFVDCALSTHCIPLIIKQRRGASYVQTDRR